MAEDSIKRVLQRNLDAALRSGDVASARAIHDRLKDLEPVALETRALEAEVLAAEGRLGDADALARQLVELHPASPRVRFLAGRLAYKGKRYGEAAAQFEEASRLHPHWTLSWWRGKALTQLGRLDEAEAILVALVASYPIVTRDLAWLYERRGDGQRALRYVERHLEAHPGDKLAAAQKLRLRARAASPEQLEEEVQALRDLGEPVAAELLAAHVEALLAQGRTADARRRLAEGATGLAPTEAERLGWICYHAQAYDLAYPLFVGVAANKRNDPKLLSSLETAARRAGKLDDLTSVYERLAVEDPRFHGRARRLRPKRS